MAIYGNALTVGQNSVSTGLQMDLLWENASPSSSFAAQTISLNLSGYDAYGVVVNFGTSDQNSMPIQIYKADSNINLLGIYGAASTTVGRRFIHLDANGIVFADAVYNAATNNGYIIPLYIYGIKGVNNT